MKKLLFYPVYIFLFLIILSSCENKKNQGSENQPAQTIAVSDTAKISKDTKDELTETEDLLILSMMNSRLQYELASLAQGRATSTDARTLNGIILNNSPKVQEKINSIAQSSNVTIPAALTPEHQAQLQKIRDMDAGEFEQAYATIVIEETQDDITRYESMQDADSPLIRGFAAETLDLLKAQLEVAKKIVNK